MYETYETRRNFSKMKAHKSCLTDINMELTM